MTGAETGPLVVGSMVGRVALVTGASRGIGAATALAFAAAGASVALVSRDREALEAVHARIRSEGGDSVVIPADVSDVADTERMVATTVQTLGRLDVAVNSAAAHGQRPTPLADISVADFDDTISISLRGVFLSMRHEIPAIIDAGGGAIVNVASTAGLTAVGGLAAYVAAKHGLIGLTKTAALDYAADDVRVNALAPGPTHTEQLERAGAEARKRVAASVPSGRLGLPDEVAAAALWLCSDQAAFITGATLIADGGLLAGSRPFTGRPGQEQS
jgi:NAD(P)-dependent dehydrogenase (short-subunit alcohol dehydrogenase family)